MDELQTFLVSRQDLSATRIVTAACPEPGEGEVLLAIDLFALTANNITYAQTGDAIGYWRFFPAPEGWGCIPVWGFATVRRSRCAGLAEGERIYGFLPMATHLVLRPERVAEASFIDATPHRQALPPAYNLYLRCAGDPSWRREFEGWQALLRPTFITSFLLDDWLGDEAFFGARQVLVSSASAKTAFGMAWLLRRRGGAEVVGLTSAANHAFVRGLGCYDRVLSYEELDRLDPALPSVYVDFAGSAALRQRVHAHFGDALRFSSAVGLSHGDLQRRDAPLPGPRAVFFFAPDRLRKRAQDWGRGGIEPRLAAQWEPFVHAAQAWLSLRQETGPAAVEAAYRAALGGRVPPDEGHLLALRAPA